MPFQLPNYYGPPQPQPFYNRPLYYEPQQNYQQRPQDFCKAPQVVETKYMLKKQGPMGSSVQANAAASFFAKAHQRLNNNDPLSAGGHSRGSPRPQNNNDSGEEEQNSFSTNFRYGLTQNVKNDNFWSQAFLSKTFEI